MRGLYIFAVLVGLAWKVPAQASIKIQNRPLLTAPEHFEEATEVSILFVLTHRSLAPCLTEFLERAEQEDRLRTGLELAIWVTFDSETSQFSCIWWSLEDRKEFQMTWRGPVPANTILQIHSHPYDSESAPSVADHKAANQINLPIVVITPYWNRVTVAFPHQGRSATLYRGDPYELIGL